MHRRILVWCPLLMQVVGRLVPMRGLLLLVLALLLLLLLLLIGRLIPSGAQRPAICVAAGRRVCRQRTTFGWLLLLLLLRLMLMLLLLLGHGLLPLRLLATFEHGLILGPRIVVGHFHADVTGVFALAEEAVPLIALASAGNDHSLEIDPGLADELCFLVVVEHGDFELEVVGGFVDGEA